ncbi:MAG: S1 RNA-binding domain-containing protein, partial [Bacteroidales bacterium]|nr:S1 RNA-binding domain-containing protein [Bacteroidales bacterium]
MEEIKNEVPVVEAPAAEAEKKETKVPGVRMNASVKPEDFDWDAFEGGDVYGAADKKAIDEAYGATLSKVVENEVVEGTVTAISKREVIVNIGYKSEGVIQAPEFRYNPDLKVGDKVEVYVESAEDRKGQLILSHKKAR